MQRRPDRVVGGQHSVFWQHCGDDELWMQECGTCALVQWPPVADRCEHCGGATPWGRLSGRGRLVSWCTFERSYYGGLLPTPWETVVVELEEGPLFIANPAGFTVADATVGDPVHVRFVDCEDSHGAFRLPVFAPGAHDERSADRSADRLPLEQHGV